MKHFNIRDIYDVVDALNLLDRSNRKIARSAAITSIGLIIAGLCGYSQAKEIERLKARIANKRCVQEMQDQLDIQEKRILQLEIELEELKKG